MKKSMNKLYVLWKKTKNVVDMREKEIVNYYIPFLRKVAKHYLKQGVKVFFHENKVVHYGEGGFGTLLIESKKNEIDVSDKYCTEIRFISKVNEKILRGYKKITLKNLNDIQYHL